MKSFGKRISDLAVFFVLLFFSCESKDLTAFFEALSGPVFGVSGGLYEEPVQVKLTAETGASIRYSTDSAAALSTRASWTLYSGTPITVDRTLKLRAYAYKDEANLSEVASADYTIKVAAPTFAPAQGSYDAAVTVILKSSTAGVQIRYTLDGTDPSAANGTLVSNGGGVTLASDCVLKARAEFSPRDPSDVVQGSYFFTPIGVGITLNLPGNLAYVWAVNSSSPPGTINLPHGSDMVVSASLPASFASAVYQWYLNGYAIGGAASNSLTVGNTGPLGLLALGTYTLSLEVRWGLAGEYSCTEKIDFNVVP